jgi:hypothetical protein
VPEAARHLHFLLATPFRYGHRSASRFRRANERPGIFYAAEAEVTAIAETAYWSLRFFSRSPGFVPPTTTVEYTSFHVRVATDRALDLTQSPFAERRRIGRRRMIILPAKPWRARRGRWRRRWSEPCQCAPRVGGATWWCLILRLCRRRAGDPPDLAFPASWWSAVGAGGLSVG